VLIPVLPPLFMGTVLVTPPLLVLDVLVVGVVLVATDPPEELSPPVGLKESVVAQAYTVRLAPNAVSAERYAMDLIGLFSSL
jgi:hypothetical protein